MSIRLRKISTLHWICIFIAVINLMLSGINFFSKTDLTPLIQIILSILFILQGWEFKIHQNQSNELGYFYFGAGCLIFVLTMIKILFR
ncbi:hypothetical protein [Neobacillus sp.]|uniref:hypothetical protein n=1 Tax=Neobacillus sp. TaxID=2675273 RepID=UPI00289DCB1D|nr:hypothetical protein [Neobacillus sp.]